MAAVEKERPLNELLSREMVDIYVGPSNTHWILHKKLLCYRSQFFRNIFNPKRGSKKASENSVYGLPDDEDEPFRLFVGWLYSERVPPPKEEKDLSPLLDMYLMAEKWEIRRLIIEVLDAVRLYYYESDTWPSLRRVQYIYANTEQESPMRQLLVQCVARMLVTGQGVPQHWENALRKNGQLAVDIILTVQKWHFDPESVPDARVGNVKEVVEEAEGKGMKMEDDQKQGREEEEEEDEDNVLDWGEGKTYSQDGSRSQSQVGGGGESDADKTLVNGH
ncbi:hypothetical protein DOTSEDRAFT_20899 [Dothistroma septosporum NZE10]|uniref:BTB domain-containing protein n=1 Tax=Dothistroma septosporum (strain NZE10 / CBS 128990) TaxID=675120 RepID=N1PXF6_DOTSN|nr:hypothetical protein DOTSEDRAFT_20899 [Dothistroma septosporum NZE10]